MARTVQAVIGRAQEILQDADGTRYPVEDLCGYVVDAIQQARSVRPDLFVGQYAAALPDTITPAEPLPLPDAIFAGVCYYVSGCAELRDDEFAVDGRAMTLRESYTKKLITGM